MNIYHNPRWSKSRKTLQILQGEGKKFTIIEYLKTPLNKENLTSLLSKLDINASELIRKNNSLYKSLSIDLNDKYSIIAALIDHPELLERPIVENKDKAIIGRPPENVLKLF